MRATSESAEWIFLATNLGLEILSAACDQASSPRRPHYAQFGMLLAIAAVLISIWELIYRGKKERVVLRRWGMLWWFYHQPPSRHTPFGTLPDIYGLVAGISQCICSIVQYVNCLRHADNPLKASLLPAIFLVCLGGSKLSNNRMNANTTDNKDSWENSSSMEENLSHAISISSVDYQEEKAASTLRARSSSLKGSRAKIPTGKLPAFIKEEVITSIYNDVFPCTAEKFFNLLLSDGSNYLHEYRSARKDTNVVIGQWHPADEYDGQLREITFRRICNSPMCPPDTAMTEWQHAVLSPDKKTLVFETVQQAHDVPFGSYFEVHVGWRLVNNDENSCTIDIKVGVYFKKWCMMQSKIRAGAINEYKKEIELMLEVARSSYIIKTTSNLSGETDKATSPSVTQDSS